MVIRLSFNSNTFARLSDQLIVIDGIVVIRNYENDDECF